MSWNRFAARCGAASIVVLLSSGCGQKPADESAVQVQDLSSAPEVFVLQADLSSPLREIPPGLPSADTHREKPLFPFREQGPTQNVPDLVLQSSPGPLIATSSGLNIPGVGNGDYGFAPNAAPPDTNGVAGATQYVQWVNESFAVFNKSTGALVYGPAAGNTLWKGFGGGCQNNNDGDPIAQYDKAANRWVMTQFSVSTTPYLQCIAVSQTSDATGAWYRYSLSMPNFPDYPKLGVWPDAYYMSFNMFKGNRFVGARACALQRSQMLIGAAANAVCFQLSNAYGGLLPSDLDGATAPPAGSPDYFLDFGTSSLRLWKFHVNFVTTSNSTFSGPSTISVPAFSEACSGGTCIPQPGTSQQLDSLADRLMYRLAYRNFGDHEALVANHSVVAGSSVGVRWYELRSPGTTPVVYQSGTFAPDSAYRWMGSIAMDHVGDIALGYSASSSSIYPSIRYTGRAPTDPLGTLGAENIILAGGGSQNGGLNRWGDYSAMAIDPADDCTFWYTNEYLKATGSFNWSTRIASFKFPGCDTPTVKTPASATPNPVTGTSTSVSVLGADDTGEPSLTYSWSSSGPAAVSFSPNGTNAAKNSTATFTQAGSYTLTAKITDPSNLSASSSVAVTVNQTLTSIAVSPSSAPLALNGVQQFGAAAKDQFGNPMSAAISWSATGGSITSSGLYTAGSTPGSFSATASSGAVSGSAIVTITDAAPVITGGPAASPSSVSGTTTSLSVTATDDGGAGNLTYSWSCSGVGFSPNGTNAASTTTANFSAAGTYNIGVTVTDSAGHTATGSVAVTVSQTLTLIAVTPGSATLAVGGSQQFSATASDQFGNAMATQPVFGWTATGGVINASGAFMAGCVPGSFGVAASVGGRSGSAGGTLTDLGPTVSASASPNPVSGNSTTVSASGAGCGLNYSWSGPTGVTFASSTSASTTATFPQAGTYGLVATVTDGGGMSASSGVSVTVSQTPTSIAVSPASAALTVGGAQQFTATANDQFGNPMTAQPVFSWSATGGTISSSGLFTAGCSPGTFAVTVSGAGLSGGASGSVTESAPSISSVSATPNPVSGNSTTVSASASGCGLTYAWSASGPAAVTFGSTTAASTSASFSQAGTYALTVTVTDGDAMTATSGVSVVVNQTLTAIAVSPASATLATGGAQQQFTASATDQFGAAMTVTPSWTASAGSIDATTGLFTSGATGGTVTVTATSGSVSGTATVSVVLRAHGQFFPPAPAAPADCTAATLVASGFTQPEGLAVDKSGLVYVVDTANSGAGAGTISRVESNGSLTSIAGGLSGPGQMVLDDAGNAFVDERAANQVTLVPLSGSPSAVANNSSAAYFNGPWGITLDASGNLLVSNQFGTSINSVTQAGAVTPAVIDGLSTPLDVKFDAAGNFYVGEFGASDVREFDATLAAVQTRTGYAGPIGIAFDAAGNLYVAEYTNGDVLRTAPDGTTTTFACGLNAPHSIAFDARGTLYIVNEGNGTVVSVP